MLAPASSSLHPVLLADLGGTTSRFALAGPRGPQQVVTMANDGLASAAAAIETYLDQIDVRPRSGVLALAGPVDGETIALTNRAWSFRLDELAAELGFLKLQAINDFEAVAWAVPSLGSSGVRAIGGPQDVASGVKVVCGPGTGLGAAALVPAGGWRVIPTEAGHTSFGPSASDEDAIFAALRAAGPVSAEMVLSGPGLVRLHQAMHGAALSSQAIVAAARDGDTAALASARMFVRLLGRFCGDLALTFKSSGGLYLTGGVVNGLNGLLDAATFRAAFEAHPPHQRLLAAIPTFLIADSEPGLVGCAVFAERMMQEASAA